MADSIVNLSALQRVDPYITEIVESATQVALYKFNAIANEWDKTGVEGTLFVYKRSGPPVYGFIIMNRLSKTNQVEPITKELELKREDPYLLYRNSKLNIFGIWFYDKNDCNKISNITTLMLQKEMEKGHGMQRMRRASESDTAIVDRLTVERTTPKNVNILSMLSKAQEEYTKHNATREGPDKSDDGPKSMIDNHNASTKLVRPKAVRAGGTPESLAAQPEKLSIETLFAMASQGKVSSALKASPVPPTAQAPPLALGNQVLQHLMSNPENLVEHIERRQRSELPPAIASSAESLEIEALKERLTRTIPSNTNSVYLDNADRELLSTIQLPSASTPLKLTQTVLTPAMLEKSMPASTTDIADTSDTPQMSALNPFTFASPTPGIPQAPPVPLMSPMMFMRKPNSTPQQVVAPVILPSSHLSTVTFPENGNMINLNIRDVGSNLTEPPPPSFLSKTQFTRAMIYLLKNDEEFVSKLHDAYVKTTGQKP